MTDNSWVKCLLDKHEDLNSCLMFHTGCQVLHLSVALALEDAEMIHTVGLGFNGLPK